MCSSSFDKNKQDTEAESDLERNSNATADEKNKCEPKKNKEINEQCLLTLAKSFIDNDPTERLLKFRAEEAESQENTNLE